METRLGSAKSTGGTTASATLKTTLPPSSRRAEPTPPTPTLKICATALAGRSAPPLLRFTSVARFTSRPPSAAAMAGSVSPASRRFRNVGAFRCKKPRGFVVAPGLFDVGARLLEGLLAAPSQSWRPRTIDSRPGAASSVSLSTPTSEAKAAFSRALPLVRSAMGAPAGPFRRRRSRRSSARPDPRSWLPPTGICPMRVDPRLHRGGLRSGPARGRLLCRA